MEARAYEIWGGEEGLRDEHMKKSEVREKKLQKKYAKEIQGVWCMDGCWVHQPKSLV